MALIKKVGIFAAVLAIGLSLWYTHFYDKSGTGSDVTDQALAMAVNTCDGITERAAKDLVAVVEFQKLEIAGRKARVFKMCMSDRGYQQNPDWLSYSTPLAKQLAQETDVSTDAAIESLSRTDMMAATGDDKRPAYWVRK